MLYLRGHANPVVPEAGSPGDGALALREAVETLARPLCRQAGSPVVMPELTAGLVVRFDPARGSLVFGAGWSARRWRGQAGSGSNQYQNFHGYPFRRNELVARRLMTS